MPGLLSSPVFLTVIWFLSWSLRPSCAQIWTDEVSDVQYGRLGSSVTLSCGKSKVRTPVVWHLNNSSALPWHQVMPDGALLLLQVNHSAQGDYSCVDSQGVLLHSIKLKLGHPPGLLNISCQVPNHTHVRCSWVESVKTFLPAKYNASFRGTGQEWMPCVVDVARKHCDVHEPAFWVPMHTIKITETNALDSSTTIFQFKLHNQLKPDPPVLKKVEEIKGHPTQFMVSWGYPLSWKKQTAFPLMFHIRYKPQGSEYWSEITSGDCQVVIFDALAGHLHLVQVRARDELDSESKWSEWSPLLPVRPWSENTTPEPDEYLPEELFTFSAKPETTTKSHNVVPEDDGNLGLVILLVLFSVVILTTVLSLIFVVWVRQKRRDHVTKQELTSMVKMKSMPI